MRRSMLLAMLPLLGCSTTAHVARTDGSVVTGTIRGSDRDTLTIDVEGESVRIARAEIDEIDHPGNGMMIYGGVGSALFGLLTIGGGVLLSSSATAAFDEDAPDAATNDAIVGLAMAIPGALGLLVHVPPTIWGYTTWQASRANAASPAAPKVSVHLGPGGVLVRF